MTVFKLFASSCAAARYASEAAEELRALLQEREATAQKLADIDERCNKKLVRCADAVRGSVSAVDRQTVLNREATVVCIYTSVKLPRVCKAPRVCMSNCHVYVKRHVYTFQTFTCI